MLENWVWEHDSLVRMSGRLKDGAPLPEDLIETLLKARQANAGLITKRQILFSLFDQTLHRQSTVNTAEIYTKMCKDVGCNDRHAFCGFDISTHKPLLRPLLFGDILDLQN